jgi:hypothetical protein
LHIDEITSNITAPINKPIIAPIIVQIKIIIPIAPPKKPFDTAPILKRLQMNANAPAIAPYITALINGSVIPPVVFIVEK